MEGGCAGKWLGQQQAEHGRSIFSWVALEKSWSANDEGCEDVLKDWDEQETKVER